MRYLVLFNFHMLSTYLWRQLWTMIWEFKFLAFAFRWMKPQFGSTWQFSMKSLLYEFNTHTHTNNFSTGLDSDTRTWAHSTHDLHYPIIPLLHLELCLTIIVRTFNSVFVLQVWNFLCDGPLNHCAFDNKSLYIMNQWWWNNAVICIELRINQGYFSSKKIQQEYKKNYSFQFILLNFLFLLLHKKFKLQEWSKVHWRSKHNKIY